MTTRHLAIAAAIAASSATSAAHPSRSSDEPTAATVARAPDPGHESGRTDTEPGDSRARRFVRGALFLPRVAAAFAFSPVEGAAYAYERYQLGDRAMRLFFNDAETIGVVPTLALESGFGINAGARFVHRDVFGQREHFDLRASTGGRFHERVATSFRTGDRLGARTALGVRAEYERRPRDTFYGLGDAGEPELRYRHRIARVTGVGDVRVAGDLHVRGAVALADHELGDDLDRLSGGVRNLYGELEVRWDGRRRTSRWEIDAVPSAGWLAAAFAGRSSALDDTASFWRYGGDLQRFISVGRGPRVISLRTHGEAVTGRGNEVPWIELPRIGGGTTLRGYAVDRFRDRVAVSGSIEYQWDLSRFLSASAFVDTGTVAPRIADLDAHAFHVGYGLALDAHSTRSLLVRATVASSVDGGIFLNLALDPVFELKGRTERR